MSQRSKPESCGGCACQHHGTDFSAIEGTGSNGVLIIGEASGEMEARDQLPFRPYAPSGAILERVLRRMGHDRQSFSITNVLRCRPKGNLLDKMPWEYSAINQCRPNLLAAIAERRPRSILALGGIATRELTGLAGEKLGVTHLAGYCLPGPDGVPTIPNLHPAYIRRGKASHIGVFSRILQRSLNIAKGTDRSWLWNVDPGDPSTWGQKKYQTHPTLDDAIAFRNWVRDNPAAVMAEDIETPESIDMDEDAREQFVDTEIRQIQFSVGKDSGIAFPWREPYKSIAVELLHSPNPKYGHNWDNYDHKVLRACSAREGWDYSPSVRVFDTLDMFHHWQPDLPAHLQFASSFIQFEFPWKHFHTIEYEPFYGACDVDSDWQLGEMLTKTLKRDDIWGSHHVGYIGQVYEVRPVLAAMESRGMPIDDAARLKLADQFEIAQADIGSKIAAQVPVEIGRVHPKEGYKGVPPEVKKYFSEAPAVEICELNIEGERFTETCEDPETYRYEQREFLIPDDNLKQVPTLRWCRVYDFNPNSRPQVISYMEAKGHPVPKDKHRENEDGDNPDTTNEKELRRLANKTGDTFYLDVIEYRGMTKLRGTYVDGFAPGPDGCVHTTFTFSTAIGQLACCASWTPICTKRGYIPIAHVKEGDFVWTHRGRWREVTNTWIYPPHEMVSVQFSNGEVMTCTLSHKLLLSMHEHIKEVADPREYIGSIEAVSQPEISHNGPVGQGSKHYDTERMLDSCSSYAIRRAPSPSQAALLAFEGREEQSVVRQEGARQSEVDRGMLRWVRVFDLSNQWEESIRASSCNGEGAGIEGTPKDIRGASHQRQSGGQPIGQSGSGDQRCPQVYTLAPKNRGEVVTIEKVVPVGCFPVYDISVDEDESYASCGVFSHNSRNPNTQNFPKLKPTPQLAMAMRKMVAAKPDKIITEWDYKSCHVITLGFLAEDLNYMRLGRLDIHSFVAGHFLNLWDGRKIIHESDAELLARFKWLKSDPIRKRVRDDQAKHGILGIGNGLKAKGLYERYMESFPPQPCTHCVAGKVPGIRGLKQCPECKGAGFIPGQRVAEGVLQTAELLFPGVFAWQKRIQRLAHEQQFLRTEFGHLRRFFEVFRWDTRRNDWGHGDQAEEAIAYWLSNIAHSHLRLAMKEIDARGFAEKYSMFNQIHDALQFHFDESLLDKHTQDIRDILTQPSPVLRHPSICPDGLVIGVEGSWGKTWAEMNEIDISIKEASHVS